MASKLFKSASPGRTVPVADTKNLAGGRAYSLSNESALAQLAVTGTFNGTYYGTGEGQLEAIKQAADGCSPEFLAKAALYARERGFMKDMPTTLCVMLSKADPALLRRVFPRVIDNGRMLRNFVQIVRSGALGRKSLGSAPKQLVRTWLETRSPAALLRASVGNDPSLADVIKLARPRPKSKEQAALFGYLLGREQTTNEVTVQLSTGANGKGQRKYLYREADLPELVKSYEAWKAGKGTGEVPNVDFRQLTALPLSTEQWTQIALRANWTMLRMNLNTFMRHGVLGDKAVVKQLAAKLRDPEQIKQARVFPYQLFMAFQAAEEGVPSELRDALQDAMESAVENVPTFSTEVQVIVDVSGSMSSAITGDRGRGATSKVRVVDVAALAAAAILRRNPGSSVLPVDTSVHGTHKLNSRDSIMTLAKQLSGYGGGGTDLAAAMRHLNQKKATGGLIVMLSDNESWITGDSKYASYGYNRGTDFMHEFREYQKRNEGAKLVCVNLQPGAHTQAPDAPNEVLNLGGWNVDALMETIKRFVTGENAETWADEIRRISLDGPAVERQDEAPVEG